MTREEARVLLPIIQAYAEGKTIQVIDTTDQCGKWEDVTDLKINTDFEEYRIKPEPKYRPFANVEECWQEMLKHQPFGWVKNNNLYRNILETSDGVILLPSFPGEMFVFSFDKAKEKFTFADGTLFGVKVEEQLWLEIVNFAN